MRARAAYLLRRSVQEFRDDHCTQMAAAISYHVLFSLFPLAIAAVGVVGLVTSTETARTSLVNTVIKVVPLTSTGQHQLQHLLSSIGGASGTLGLLGLLGVLWSASGMMSAIRVALNIAWDTDEHRPFVRGKLVDLVLVGIVMVLVGLALALTVVTSLVRHSGTVLGPGWHVLTGVAASVGAFLGAFALLFAVFLFLYRVVPVVRTTVRQVWVGALVAAVAFEAVQYGFAVYVSHFAHYNKIYGSLGAVVAFLFFVYLASAAFLFGAEVASEYPRMPARLPEPQHGQRRRLRLRRRRSG